MNSTNKWVELYQTSIQPSQGPIYHVYSHYGCSSKDIDRCNICRYLLQPNTYLHPNPQSLLAATQHQHTPTPIKPTRYRIDDRNDLYLLPEIPGSPRTRRQAEDAAIINICSKDKSIDRIILVDADEDNDSENYDDDDVLYVRLYDVEKNSSI